MVYNGQLLLKYGVGDKVIILRNNIKTEAEVLQGHFELMTSKNGERLNIRYLVKPVDRYQLWVKEDELELAAESEDKVSEECEEVVRKLIIDRYLDLGKFDLLEKFLEENN